MSKRKIFKEVGQSDQCVQWDQNQKQVLGIKELAVASVSRLQGNRVSGEQEK